MRVEEKLYDRRLADTVTSIMEKCKTKQELHTALLREFSDLNNGKVGKIYRAVRPLFDSECAAPLMDIGCVVPLPAS